MLKVDIFKKMCYNKNMNEIKKLKQILEAQLWEMANLPKKRTGLPVIVYISGNKSSHGPRIKFFDSYADSIGENYDLLIPLTVGKNPEIPIEHKLNIKKKDLEKIRQWVIKNYNLLMDLYNGKIDEIDAGNQQQKL